MGSTTSIVWFRNDLRLADNPALTAAAQRGAVVPVFIWSPETEGRWPPGGASRWWLHYSLRALEESLSRKGSRLVVRSGDPARELAEVARETGARRAFWNRRFEPAAAHADELIADEMESAGIETETFNGGLLLDPARTRNAAGGPFRVFTAFHKSQLLHTQPTPPLPSPPRLAAPAAWPAAQSIELLGLLPSRDWAGGIAAIWTPGEAGAEARLRAFKGEHAAEYDRRRDTPSIEGTSRLSPHLHFGEISPRQVWAAVSELARGNEAGAYLRQIAWREFAHHLLHHYPHTAHEPLRPEFARFPWIENDRALRAWQRGRTGYPIVDAGMRQLWATGWMHNRVRMIVASFLVKDLLIHWLEGARWFWDTLVDADLANNTLGWQWTAGCGADAAPFFRIFNPVLQGKKFDAEGAYIRQWVPELARFPATLIHEPWRGSAAELKHLGVRLGREYPTPIVDHATARDRALEAFQRIKR